MKECDAREHGSESCIVYYDGCECEWCKAMPNLSVTDISSLQSELESLKEENERLKAENVAYTDEIVILKARIEVLNIFKTEREHHYLAAQLRQSQPESKPHKCPACSGNGKSPAFAYASISTSTHLCCSSCQGKGIVWG